MKYAVVVLNKTPCVFFVSFEEPISNHKFNSSYYIKERLFELNYNGFLEGTSGDRAFIDIDNINIYESKNIAIRWIIKGLFK